MKTLNILRFSFESPSYIELVNDRPIAADELKILYRLYRNARKHHIVFFS